MRIETFLVISLLHVTRVPALRRFWSRGEKRPRIIEGVEVDQEDYPFMASIIYNEKHVCGGSVISGHFVLTAAHCTFNAKRLPRELDRTVISVGSSDWKTGTKYQPSKRYAHDKYNKAKTIYDIGLFKTEDKMKFGDFVSPVKLNTKSFDNVDMKCFVLGWGFTSSEGLLVKKAANVLYMVQINTISLEKCRRSFKNVYDGNICLTGEGRKGSCRGDSGGPLVSMIDGEMVQVGLVSYGGDCNNTLPEVHTRVSTFFDWIVETTRDLLD